MYDEYEDDYYEDEYMYMSLDDLNISDLNEFNFKEQQGYGYHHLTDRFNLDEFPSNCSWVIITEVNKLTKNGLEDAIGLARRCNYSNILLSISSVQNHLFKLLEEMNFKIIHENVNVHSGNTVYLYIGDINYD